VPLLEPVLKGRTTREWEGCLTAAGVPHAPVWDYATLFTQSQAEARGLRVTVRDPQGRPVELIGSPFHIGGTTLPSPSMPPALGQHTEEVLREVLGLNAARVEELRRAGVVQ
jgi:crotonobetainyl-CoA:carnitine CoA-transferase CaiB-like acyl-CoA transferase